MSRLTGSRIAWAGGSANRNQRPRSSLFRRSHSRSCSRKRSCMQWLSSLKTIRAIRATDETLIARAILSFRSWAAICWTWDARSGLLMGHEEDLRASGRARAAAGQGEENSPDQRHAQHHSAFLMASSSTQTWMQSSQMWARRDGDSINFTSSCRSASRKQKSQAMLTELARGLFAAGGRFRTGPRSLEGCQYRFHLLLHVRPHRRKAQLYPFRAGCRSWGAGACK